MGKKKERERLVVCCLRSAIDNPRSEMERPSDWISRDPDLSCLCERGKDSPSQGRLDETPPCQEPLDEDSPFQEFLRDQRRLDYPGERFSEVRQATLHRASDNGHWRCPAQIHHYKVGGPAAHSTGAPAGQRLISLLLRPVLSCRLLNVDSEDVGARPEWLARGSLSGSAGSRRWESCPHPMGLLSGKRWLRPFGMTGNGRGTDGQSRASPVDVGLPA